MNASLLQTTPLLTLKGEDIAYSGVAALKNVTLSIAEGEKVALIGQSGAGKTTLLRRLYQLVPNQCAFIHQHYALVPQLSAFHNIYMGRLDSHSALHNLYNLIKPYKRHIEEITPIVKKLGLEDKLFVKVGELSGGQQQRVGIGRALYRGGAVLMADEPVSSLDVIQGEEVMELITNSGKTVISSLHSLDLSTKFFDRVIGLRHERILFDLPAQHVSRSKLSELYA
jgi:phosphonate transport system ATP-binding protein